MNRPLAYARYRASIQSLIIIFAGLPGLRLISSSRRGSSNVQVIEVQRRVEEQREAAVRFMPPHRVIGEHHDVPFAYGHIEHDRFASQFRTAREHAADQ